MKGGLLPGLAASLDDERLSVSAGSRRENPKRESNMGAVLREGCVELNHLWPEAAVAVSPAPSGDVSH